MTKAVVHFIDSDTFGGTERVALQLLEDAVHTRWRPVLFHHDEPGLAGMIERVDGLGIQRRVVPRMMRLRDYVKHRGAFGEALRSVDAEVFHAHLHWPLSCKYGLVAARRARVRAVVATAHVRLDLSGRLILRVQPRLIARAVDRYLAVSRGVSDQLIDALGIPSSKIELTPNGVDVGRFGCARSEALRAELTGSTDRPVVMTVARLSEQKGHRDLIDAAAQIDDVVFVFVGDGPLSGELRQRCASLGIAERVRLLGARGDVPELLACADLFVLPSLYEGMPLSLIEAMAARVPVVGTDIPGNNELIDHGETGLLTPLHDPDSLAGAIRRALGDPASCSAWAASAYQRVVSRHDRLGVSRRIADIYDRVLSEGAHARS